MRSRTARLYGDLFLTFLISGLWHGAALNFIIWGAYHGLLQILEKITGYTRYISNIRKFRSRAAIILITQLEVLIGWVFFRASSWSESCYVLKRLFSFSSEKNPLKTDVDFWIVFLVFWGMELFLILKADTLLLHKYRWYRRLEPILIGLLLLTSIIFRGEKDGFIYFQF